MPRAKTISSRTFNQDVSGAKRMADEGPVTITDRGKPAYVLMTHAAFERLAGRGPSIVDMLDHAASADIEFEPERIKGGPFRPVDLG